VGGGGGGGGGGPGGGGGGGGGGGAGGGGGGGGVRVPVTSRMAYSFLSTCRARGVAGQRLTAAAASRIVPVPNAREKRHDRRQQPRPPTRGSECTVGTRVGAIVGRGGGPPQHAWGGATGQSVGMGEMMAQPIAGSASCARRASSDSCVVNPGIDSSLSSVPAAPRHPPHIARVTGRHGGVTPPPSQRRKPPVRCSGAQVPLARAAERGGHRPCAPEWSGGREGEGGACPIGTGEGTRRVHLIRGGGG